MPQRQYSYDAFGNISRKTEYTPNYNASVKNEILSFTKMQIANGVSSVNSEILSFIISQEIGKKIKGGCGE